MRPTVRRQKPVIQPLSGIPLLPCHAVAMPREGHAPRGRTLSGVRRHVIPVFGAQ